jgi:hypothetical protein
VVQLFSLGHIERIDFMSRPSQGTVEGLITELGGIAPPGSQNFELWVPQDLTLKSKPFRHDFAMALVLNKILGMGFTVDGFTEAEGGRVYRYKVMT